MNSVTCLAIAEVILKSLTYVVIIFWSCWIYTA